MRPARVSYKYALISNATSSTTLPQQKQEAHLPTTDLVQALIMRVWITSEDLITVDKIITNAAVGSRSLLNKLL